MIKNNNGESQQPPPPGVKPKGEGEAAPKDAPEQQAVPGAPSSYLVTARRNATDFIRGTFAITPDDANALPKASLGVWVGGAGNLTCKMQDGSTGTFTAIPAGTMMPLVVTQVMATGTTATLLVGCR